MFKVNNKDTSGVVLVSLLLSLNIFHTCVLVFLLLTFEYVIVGRKGEKSNHSFSTFAKFSGKLTFLTPFVPTCAYQG